ncbi:MAG TPA: ion channel [Candidatus Dormibacteraeota bacterium]|nr:ion channel [Candidatus Dormibacteraeota bacterium]
MNGMIETASVIAGIFVLAVTFYDFFQAAVLPRPAVRKVQLTRLVVPTMWRAWRWVSLRTSQIDRSEGRLASFAPVALIVLVLIWAAALVFGYALIMYGIREEFHPVLQDFPEAFYVSASTLVPLAYGDFVPEVGPARLLIIVESANGVAYAAVAITLLFELYGSFRDREEAVVALDALAGAPASAVQLLETARDKQMGSILETTFDEWRKWSAKVLESHLAYPLLIYFRSSHDNEAWINSFGAVMDAASLVVSSMDDEPSAGAAKLMLTVGNHMSEDLAWVFRLQTSPDPILEREEYVQAVARLRAAGYNAQDGEQHWQKFAKIRGKYATALNQIAQWLSTPPAPWVGDRSYLPHRQRPRRRAAPKAAA